MYIFEGLWEQIYIFNLYVYDILLATNDLDLLSETTKFLSNNFEIKNIGKRYCIQELIRIPL